MLNTGVSTTRALQPAARALAAQGILLGYTDLLTQLDRVSASIRKEEGGTHADEVETSMMLYIDSASVDMRRAVKEFNPSSGPSLQLTRRRGGPGTFSESGVWGDPTLATREKGRVIVEGLVKQSSTISRPFVLQHLRRRDPCRHLNGRRHLHPLRARRQAVEPPALREMNGRFVDSPTRSRCTG